MELISKVSKGTKMDQIYIPKNRTGFDIGKYVLIKPLNNEERVESDRWQKDKLYLYKINNIEPIKIEIIKSIIKLMGALQYDNLIFVGSFLEAGFNFNDIDILIISESHYDLTPINKEIHEKIGILPHIISMSGKELNIGLQTDPLYTLMLSKSIAKKRFIFNIKRKIEPKVIDMHLLKSKSLIGNYDYLSGNDKYYLTRNMFAIQSFIENKEINKESIDKRIVNELKLKSIQELKNNLQDKISFLKKYKQIYNNTFDKVLNLSKKQEDD